ncbi:unnamed protein product, partial [Sphacelaria rigidula]
MVIYDDTKCSWKSTRLSACLSPTRAVVICIGNRDAGGPHRKKYSPPLQHKNTEGCDSRSGTHFRGVSTPTLERGPVKTPRASSRLCRGARSIVARRSHTGSCSHNGDGTIGYLTWSAIQKCS